uniref:Uncharacterized protein n=1 Tax=Anguilla anguilla TaxID=7936 RepID=A0A0E9SBP5_ANGAN
MRRGASFENSLVTESGPR